MAPTGRIGARYHWAHSSSSIEQVGRTHEAVSPLNRHLKRQRPLRRKSRFLAAASGCCESTDSHATLALCTRSELTANPVNGSGRICAAEGPLSGPGNRHLKVVRVWKC